MPTAALPSATSATPALAPQAAMIFQGICVMMPAPSPLSSSALHPPRCSMHPSAVSACDTVRWLRSACAPGAQSGRK